MYAFSPDGSGIPSRFFCEMEYSGQRDDTCKKCQMFLLQKIIELG